MIDEDQPLDQFTQDLIRNVIREVNKATTIGEWLGAFGALSSIQALVWMEIWKNADPDLVVRGQVLRIVVHLHTVVASASPEIVGDLMTSFRKDES